MFNDTLNACDLNDLGYHGNIFTWANNQPNNIHIRERLDRFCANSNWISSFPIYINKHLLRYSSDHCPILLEFYEDTTHNVNTKKFKILRYENIWSQDQDSQSIVPLAWDNSTGPSPNKLKFVLEKVSRWGRAKHGDIPT